VHPGTCWATLLLGLTTPVAAQGVPDSTRRDTLGQRLQTVRITETRSAGTVGGASAVIMQVEGLRTSPAPLLHEALRETPFVHVRLNSRGEMELSVRGSSSRQAAVLIDGVPITLGFDHRTDPSLVPITGSQRVVVVPGLGSLLNGPNSLGGTIEVNHDDARARTAQTWAGFGIDQTGATTSTLGTSRPVADLGGGSMFLRAGLAHRQRDGVAVPEEALDPTEVDGLRTNSDLREIDGFASVRWSNPIGRSVGVTVSAFDAEKGVPPEEHIAEPRLWRYPYNRRSIIALSATSGALTTPFGFGTLEVGVGRNSGRLKIETYDSRAYDNVTGQELGEEGTTTLRTKATHSLGSRASLRAALTATDVKYTETLGTDPGVDYRQRLFSGGAELDVTLREGTVLTGGLVYDRARSLESGGREESPEPFTAPGWRAGVAHTLNESWRVHASVNQRSRFPSLRELYSGALNRFTPNPDLEPETLRGYEAGFTFDRFLTNDVALSLSMNGFRQGLDDALVRITLSNPTRFMRVNRDRIESTGIEALAGFTLGQDPDRAVTLNGDLLLQDITVFDESVGDAARHAENDPERRASLELGVPLPMALRGIAAVRHTGRQYCLNADTGAEMKLEAQSVANLSVERHVSIGTGLFRSLRALFALDNLGDATVYDQCGLPQPGRTLRVMFSFR
jgi:iron complex outermembrane receptor protein